MGLKCRIVRKADGVVEVLNEDGTQSSLYQSILSYTGNQEAALNLWAVGNGKEFQTETGITSPTIENILDYISVQKQQVTKLTPSELLETKALMRRSGITKLSQLVNKLKEIVGTGSEVFISPEKAISSKIFLPEDLENLSLDKMRDVIDRMEGQLALGDFEVIESKMDEVMYRNTETKNFLGASEYVSTQQLEKEIIDLVEDFNNPEQFSKAINQLPYQELVDKYNSDTKFAESFQNKFKGLKKLKVVEIQDGKLVAAKTNTFTQTKNTLLSIKDTTAIEADIEYLQNMPESIWNQNPNLAKEVIKEIEQELLKSNIDVIGLSEILKNKNDVVSMLESVLTMVQSPTDANIRNFSEQYDAVFEKPAQIHVQRLPKALQGLTIVKMYSDKSAQELFETQGLIKVGENLYHKINTQEQTADLYEYLYQEVLDGNMEIPKQFSTTNVNDKLGTIKDLENFVNSRDSGMGFYNEKINLYQLIYNYPTTNVSALDDVSKLQDIQTDTNYLKTKFISDFYNYILREKSRNSTTYREVLSKFQVTDKDLVLTDYVDSLTDIEMYKELMDYARLQKDSTIKRYLPVIGPRMADRQVLAINYPNEAPIYEGDKNTVGNLIITPNNPQEMIRTTNGLFTLIHSGPLNTIYAKVVPNTNNNNYYQTEVQIEDYNKDVFNKLVKQDLSESSKLSPAEIEARKEKAGLNSTFYKKLKEKSLEVFQRAKTSLANTFNPQLISQKNNLRRIDRNTLDIAKDMFSKGLTPLEIFEKTNWFKNQKGYWIREVGDVKFLEPYEEDLQTDVETLLRDKKLTVNLEDFFDVSELKRILNTSKIDLTVEYEEIKEGSTEEESASAVVKVVRGNYEIVTKVRGKGDNFIKGFLSNRSNYRAAGLRDDNQSNFQRNLESMVNHELQHILQRESLRKTGNDPKAIFDYYATKNAGYLTNIKSNEEGMAILAKIYNVNNFLDDIVYPIYQQSVGEVEAVAVQKRLKNKEGIPNLSTPFQYDITDYSNNNVPDGLEEMLISSKDKYRIGDEIKDVDQVYQENLIEFIRSKGVNVISDRRAMKDKLKSLGFDSINAMINLPQVGIKETESIKYINNNYTALTIDFGRTNKVKTEAQAIRIMDKLEADARKNLKKLLKDSYNDAFIRRIHLNLILDVPKNVSEKFEASQFVLQDSVNSSKKFIEQELKRGVSPQELRELGYNFLQTPKGNILGFESNGEIYLDPEQLNTTTTLHELIHVYQSVIQIRADKGDKTAQAIIDKRKELFQDIANEWKEFHKNNTNVSLPSSQIGLDLSSQVYAQRNNETDNEYNNRILLEIEAYITSPEIAKKLDNLKNENPSLWKQITDFIKQITDFLKNQIGLYDYKGDISNMTKQEYIDALGVSILKDEYSIDNKITVQEAIKRNNSLPLNLAPNGKPSILYKSYKDLGYSDSETENLVAQVYSDSFKNWFGDWQKSIQNSSKVVDENGQPLLVFHGTKSTDITVFDRSKKKRQGSGLKEFGHYFTTNIKLARAYKTLAKISEEELRYINSEIYKLREILDRVRNNREFNEINSRIELLESSKRGKIYPVFLNLRNIKSFDAKGKEEIEGWRELKVDAGYKMASNRDAMKFLKDGEFGVEKVEGVLAKNIVDAFVQGDADLMREWLGDVYLVFDGQEGRIKSATENIGTFSNLSNDIRFQAQPLPQKSVEQLIQEERDIQALINSNFEILYKTTEEQELEMYNQMDSCS